MAGGPTKNCDGIKQVQIRSLADEGRAARL
jgi:hypothetical protein